MKKTVLITGCSSGIGRATVHYFQQQGWQVAATMRTPEKETELGQLPGVKLFRLDVLDNDSIQKAISDVISTFGGIDVLINNAGYGSMGVFEAATDAQIQRQFETNLFGVMRVIKAVLPHFRSKRNGLFLNISSIGGMITMPLYALYHSTKWALEGFTEALRYELEPLNIQVKLIEPGHIKTDFATRSQEVILPEPGSDYQPYLDKILASYGEKKHGGAAPEEVAKTIFEAATDQSNQLRYATPVESVEGFLKMRRELPVEDFMNNIKMYVEN